MRVAQFIYNYRPLHRRFKFPFRKRRKKSGMLFIWRWFIRSKKPDPGRGHWDYVKVRKVRSKNRKFLNYIKNIYRILNPVNKVYNDLLHM
jgi:hypothetical protein